MPLNVIDEISNMVFKQLDRLDQHLTYHCKEHTADVVQQSKRIALAEGITDEHTLFLLHVAALYHDSGFLNTYSHHEEESCKIFLTDTVFFDFSDQDKDTIRGLILATKVPQLPTTHLQQIICDADLDYLGRPDFFEIGDTLRREFIHFGVVSDDTAWHHLQMKFLKNHHYHTISSQKLREPVKQEHIKAIS